MQLQLHEEWSPELLSELQRAVPVLESGSLELDEADTIGFGASNDSVGWGSTRSVGSGGLRLGGWAADANSLGGTGTSGTMVPPADLLSSDAMALPMSTLTSGKRRTFPNKSTFQAHVCCIMDPLQAPRVLEALKRSPQFKTARSWPHAYRIISPFDGQVHEGSDDDDDFGAGEKMLGLLKRMRLENLFLVVSRWGSGQSQQLGLELFRCVNEQCKNLLRELQQAVRASFPPEELLNMSQPQQDGGRTRHGALHALRDGNVSDDDCDESGSDEGMDDQTGTSSSGRQERKVMSTSRHVDVRAIGATPPSELWNASRGVAAMPIKRRKLPGFSPVSKASPRGHFDARAVGATPSLPHAPAHPHVPSSICLQVQKVPQEVKQKSEKVRTILKDADKTGFQLPAASVLEEMSSEDLIRLGAALRIQRTGLEDILATLGGADEVIAALKLPVFSGLAVRAASAASTAATAAAAGAAGATAIAASASNVEADAAFLPEGSAELPA